MEFCTTSDGSLICEFKFQLNVIMRYRLIEFNRCLNAGIMYDLYDSHPESEASTSIIIGDPYVIFCTSNLDSRAQFSVSKNESLVRAFAAWEHWLSLYDDLWINWTTYTLDQYKRVPNKQPQTMDGSPSMLPQPAVDSIDIGPVPDETPEKSDPGRAWRADIAAWGAEYINKA